MLKVCYKWGILSKQVLQYCTTFDIIDFIQLLYGNKIS